MCGILVRQPWQAKEGAGSVRVEVVGRDAGRTSTKAWSEDEDVFSSSEDSKRCLVWHAMLASQVLAIFNLMAE